MLKLVLDMPYRSPIIIKSFTDGTIRIVRETNEILIPPEFTKEFGELFERARKK